MFNVCPACGLYSAEKPIDPCGSCAVCPYCGHRHPFLQLPLFILTGSSATGKSTICLELATRLSDCVCIECDILWRPEFATPEDDYHGLRDLCLRVAKNVGQAGHPVLLCGSATPEQYENCPERRYFGTTHYLALICDDDELIQRLQSRPAWRQSSTPEFVATMLQFNQWFKDNAHDTHPPITLLNTTSLSIAQSVERVANWVHSRLSPA
jgi:gluconate kinase